MKLKLYTVQTKENREVEVELSNTVLELKTIISTKYEINQDQIKLLVKGKIMKNESLISA